MQGSPPRLQGCTARLSSLGFGKEGAREWRRFASEAVLYSHAYVQNSILVCPWERIGGYYFVSSVFPHNQNSSRLILYRPQRLQM